MESKTSFKNSFACEPCQIMFSTKSKRAHHNQTHAHQMAVALTMIDYKQEGAKTEIRPSVHVKGQQGLFLAQDVKRGQIITWYHGKSFATEDDLNAYTSRHGQGDRYVFRVPKGSLKTNELYFIDACESKEDSAPKLCLAAYMNHSKKAPNCRYQYAEHGKADFGVGVAMIAIHDMVKDTELVFNYGTSTFQVGERSLATSGRQI